MRRSAEASSAADQGMEGVFAESEKVANTRRSLNRAKYEFMINYGEHTNLPLDIAEQHSFADNYGNNACDVTNIFMTNNHTNADAKSSIPWRRVKTVVSKEMSEPLSPIILPDSGIFRDNATTSNNRSATKPETSMQGNILNNSSDDLFLEIFGEKKLKEVSGKKKVGTPYLTISPRRKDATYNAPQGHIYPTPSITILDTENFQSSDDLFPKETSLEPYSVDFSQQNRQNQGGDTPYDNVLIRKRVHLTKEEPEQKKQKTGSCQTDKWLKRYDELVEFQKKNKHCLVPHDFSANIELARWVKRQRYQYNLFLRHEKSSITEERIKLLGNIGFVWGAQEANWEERFKELVEYKKIHGHCDVHTKSSSVPKLGTWVRCQRRQYQLFMEGKRSNMTRERIAALENLGLRWKIRSSKSSA